MPDDLLADNKKLLTSFGADSIDKLKSLPDFYTFNKGLIYSHRDFDKFYSSLKRGEKCAIVSGFNASGNMHLGHLGVFDTNMYFQREHGLKVFIPISDDESYVSLKVKTQEEAMKNALTLVRTMIGMGFDPGKTHIIIDYLYTDIYNLAIKLSRGVTMSEIRAVYGYTHDQNAGLHFYPAVQAAHVTLPQTMGIPNVLVPIGPDEDAHLRVCRDMADKFGYNKPAVLHSRFFPGTDGNKMSKSRNNAIFFLEDEKSIKKKVMAAFSGGQTSVEEHRRLGGNPDVDVAFLYLKSYFLSEKESDKIGEEYRSGKLLSGELKQMLFEKLMKRVGEFRKRYDKVTPRDIEKILLKNEDVDVQSIIERMGIFKD